MSTLNPDQIIAPAAITPAAATQYYVVPANTVTTIRRITFCNVTATAATFTVYYVPNLGAFGITNMVINEERLGPKKSVSPPELEGLVLEAGDTIWIATGTDAAITVVGAGTEIA